MNIALEREVYASVLLDGAPIPFEEKLAVADKLLNGGILVEALGSLTVASQENDDADD